MYLRCKYGVLEVEAQLRLHWKDRFGYCAPFKPVTTVQRVGSSENLRKTTVGSGGFFFNFFIMLKLKRESSYSG